MNKWQFKLKYIRQLRVFMLLYDTLYVFELIAYIFAVDRATLTMQSMKLGFHSWQATYNILFILYLLKILGICALRLNKSIKNCWKVFRTVILWTNLSGVLTFYEFKSKRSDFSLHLQISRKCSSTTHCMFEGHDVCISSLFLCFFLILMLISVSIYCRLIPISQTHNLKSDENIYLSLIIVVLNKFV